MSKLSQSGTKAPTEDKWKTNDFAKKYKAKNDARSAALERRKGDEVVTKAMRDIPSYLRRDKKKLAKDTDPYK